MGDATTSLKHCLVFSHPNGCDCSCQLLKLWFRWLVQNGVLGGPRLGRALYSALPNAWTSRKLYY
jgi:hypothetical protein